MRVTALPKILRGAGVKVIEIAGAETHDHGPLLGVRGIICHHTAGPAASSDPSSYPSLRTVRDGRPGLAGPLAQLGLGRDGVWYVISAGRAWHAGTVLRPEFGNDWTIGIECEATGTLAPGDWPAEQVDSLTRGVTALLDAFNLPVDSFRGHKEICSPRGRKIDPHPIGMDTLRARVTALTQPTPTPVEDNVNDADARLLTKTLWELPVGKQADFDGSAITYGEAYQRIYNTVMQLGAAMTTMSDAVHALSARVEALSGGATGGGGLTATDVEAAAARALQGIALVATPRA